MVERLGSKKKDKLFQEVEMLMETDHPNILKLFHLYEDPRNYIMVTEYCSGGELFDRIQKAVNFSEKMVAELMKQILGAVTYLHERHIVHRDLKVENLLFENTNADANLKLIDFGTSKKFIPGVSKNMKKVLGTVSRALIF